MENVKPLISVIVPVYNGENYLSDCVESIVCQTYQNLEIIIINDGSTDGTGLVCARLQETYDNVQIITMNDKGVSAARNAGIETANGELITFVDADDRLQPDMVQVLYDCMVRTGSDIAGCQFFIWKSDVEWNRLKNHRFFIDEFIRLANIVPCGDKYRRMRERHGICSVESLFPSKVYDSDTYVKEAVLQGNSRCWSKLYRRSVIGKMRFKEGLSIGEDMLFLVNLLPYAEKIAETDYPGYGYFQNPKGAINRGFTPGYMDQITCWEIARDEIRQIDKSLDAQVTAILIMGIMLTAGKLAMLPSAERRRQKEYVQICQEKLKEALLVPGAYEKLSGGYKIKAKLFKTLPNLYLTLYHLQKSGRSA